MCPTRINFDDSMPRPEHPRPSLQRDAWRNLNGAWRFAFDPHMIGEQQRWYSPSSTREKNLTITVPFPWESKLSGVERDDYKGAAWYEREFSVPSEWEGVAPILHFGAVDWHARVWINGEFAAEHENGYLPFSVDLRPFVQPGQTATVTVRAYDAADASTLVGKQVPWWYTHSSGIWQTVWLEGCPPSRVTGVRVEPEVADEQATVKLALHIDAAGSYRVRLLSPDDAFDALETEHELDAGAQSVTLTLPVASPHLWSPESPHLYDLVIELVPSDGTAPDRVTTYFGMRTVARGPWNDNGFEYILLNGEPVYLRGALDQAFHPDALHNYPSDEVIRGDIQLAKDLGLNMLRCHIKINDPRYYYWADKLGLLVMYDIPSPDIDTPTMRRIFQDALPRAVARDFNSPSIFAWVLFNETWGLTRHHTPEAQAWLAQMVDVARGLDPTRLIEDNSPCRFDHVESDINSWHYYLNDYTQVRAHVQQVVDHTYPGSDYNYVGGDYVQSTAPLMNSEYGGIAANMGDQDIAWCFKYQTTELRRHAKICGYVYTELDDIEWEHNGFVNYDRSAKEFGYDFFVPEMTVADLNGADFVGLDTPPCQTLEPGSEFRAPLFVSHWGDPMSKATVRWQLRFIDRFGGGEGEIVEGSVAVEPRRFDVVDAGELMITLPNENGLATVALWLEDESGTVRGRNYVNVEVRRESLPQFETLPEGWVLRFQPGSVQDTSWIWPRPYLDPGGAKFSAQGAGWVEYALSLPAELPVEQVREVRFRFEAAARAGRAKVDWPQKMNGTNYPQTDVEKKYPTDVRVFFNDVAVGTAHLPDDPADARGVLSHHRRTDPGAYGYLVSLHVDGDTLREVLGGGSTLRIRFDVDADAAHAGGFSLYGETLGCFPLGPTLLFDS